VRRLRDAVIDAAAWLRPKVNRQRSSIKHAEDATPLGFWVLSQRHPGQDPGRPEGNHAAEEPAAALTWRSWSMSMDYRIGRLNWFTTWLDGYLQLAAGVQPRRRG
jgi:RNA-directed DNA polymerase